MSLTTSHPAVTTAPRSEGAARERTWGSVILTAGDAVACIPLDDARWRTVGARLTAVVDAVRRANGHPGSPIGAHETVAPVLRLRDLGCLSRIIDPSATVEGPEVIEDLLWSLQVAAL
ncbi:MAG: hypothetical protein WEB03_00155 [Nitriliruptor sp.]|uniref:hypothetical protein n=1 Tax=Nitriliruptor sp. TaxID=2448056 RepID=UPI00349FF105